MFKSVAVLGIGQFGSFLVDELVELGVDVLIADQNIEIINRYADKVSLAMAADLTSPEAIKNLGIADTEVVVVAMGDSMEASIMCIMVAKELGVPRVIAKAATERLGKIFTKVGADEVVYPEEESAQRTARRAISSSIVEYFSIGNDMAVASILPYDAWVGKSLLQLNLRSAYGVNVVAVKEGEHYNARIDPKKPLSADEELLVAADQEDMDRLMMQEMKKDD